MSFKPCKERRTEAGILRVACCYIGLLIQPMLLAFSRIDRHKQKQGQVSNECPMPYLVDSKLHPVKIEVRMINECYDGMSNILVR